MNKSYVGWTGETPGFLVGTMQSAQDEFEAWVKYFNEELIEGLKIE